MGEPVLMLKTGEVRAYIESRGLTQEMFADQLGLSSSCVSRLLAGKRSPSAKFITHILYYTDLEFDDIFYIAEKEGGA